MFSVYDQCPCSSGKKFKFCCYLTMKASDDESLSKLSVQWPFIGCFLAKNWKTIGKTSLCIVKEMPNKQFFTALFLLDLWCLGVKDSFIRTNLDSDDVRALIEGIHDSSNGGVGEIYEDARSLIFGSLQFAKSLGLSPHHAWRKIQYAVEPERPFTDKFEFGKNGKPLYIEGPYDKKELNIKDIVKKVTAHGGHWIMNID